MSNQDSQVIQDAVIDYIERKLSEEFDKQLDEMIANLKNRRAELIAAGVLRLEEMYEVELSQNRVVITIRKEEV